METAAKQENNKIHPHKFNLWIGIGSIIMMFAGLTSAYIVKRNQAGWTSFDLSAALWLSTCLILLSSVTMYLAKRSFKERDMKKYRHFMLVTFILGVLFMIAQVFVFKPFWGNEDWSTTWGKISGNVSSSFLFVLIMLHAAHVFGGVVALGVTYKKAYSSKVKNYSILPVELVSTYWHFVDILWIYLLLFLIMIR
jgi:cytochrome c oxidase subunit 3